VQDEPQWWHKRPTYHKVRKAPLREQDRVYNRPRCVHGSYMDEPCSVNAYCEASYSDSGRAQWIEAGRPAMW
jgi:hypothetical protein